MMMGIGDFKKHKCLVAAALLLTGVIVTVSNLPKREDRTFIDVTEWKTDTYPACGGNFTGFGHQFARLRHVLVNKSSPGQFSIVCNDGPPSYKFQFGKEGSHLNAWMAQIKTVPSVSVGDKTTTVFPRTTLAVQRYEAHNLYHTMTDWYGVFLVSKLLELDPATVDILLMDDRPPGLMDATWDVLFGTVYKLKDLNSTVVFSDLIWNVLGYESPLNFHMLVTLPYADEFYRFFIGAFGTGREKTVDCSRLQTTIIWRRDYMSHPERREQTGGLIHRKFTNEKEILAEVMGTLKGQGEGHTVTGVVLEDMSMEAQLALFTKTDILIGMHGAGMAHAMFLPSHAAIFETFPNYWSYLKHFKAFARWRGLHYSSWRNEDEANEFPYFRTYIPPDIVRQHVSGLYGRICNGSGRH